MRNTIPWSKIEKTKVCWNWIGSIHDSGYGILWEKGKRTRAHRSVYEALVGKIPLNKVIDHLCRNRKCVNPKHMEIVTRGENVLRGESFSAINKNKTRCSKGHEYTSENTILFFKRTVNKTQRVCKICRRVWNRKGYIKRLKQAHLT